MEHINFFSYKQKDGLINDRVIIQDLKDNGSIEFIKSFTREDFHSDEGYYEYSLLVNEINLLSKSPFLRFIT